MFPAASSVPQAPIVFPPSPPPNAQVQRPAARRVRCIASLGWGLSRTRVSLKRAVGQVPDDLGDPLVIEYRGDPAGASEQAHPLPHDDRVRMIHFQPLAIDQRYSEWA